MWRMSVSKLIVLLILQQQLRMRIRLNYVVNGAPVVEQAEVNNFPTMSWQWNDSPTVDGLVWSDFGGVLRARMFSLSLSPVSAHHATELQSRRARRFTIRRKSFVLSPTTPLLITYIMATMLSGCNIASSIDKMRVMWSTLVAVNIVETSAVCCNLLQFSVDREMIRIFWGTFVT